MPKYLFLSLFFGVILPSCGDAPVAKKSKESRIPETKTAIKTTTGVEGSTEEPEHELELFDLWKPDEDNRSGFISLSDIDHLSENEDSLAIPDVSEWSYAEAKYVQLDSKYRKRFLARTSISENDRVFIYNYASDLLVSVPVKELKVAACLSLYVGENETPFSQMDYHIGFEVSQSLLKDFKETDFNHTLVYVGKENPFIRGQMKPMKWKKMDVKQFPLAKMRGVGRARIRKLARGKTMVYAYTRDSLSYFVREMFEDEIQVSRCVVVWNKQTDQLVFERIYEESEGAGFAPLNAQDPESEYLEQWNGQLLKNRGPVLFGWMYYSFGCPEISFLGKNAGDSYINCDNRH